MARRILTGVIVYLAFAVIPCLFAQGTGTIHGSVTDPSSGAVANAKVVAVLGERGTTRTVATDPQGSYVFPGLPIGALR